VNPQDFSVRSVSPWCKFISNKVYCNEQTDLILAIKRVEKD